MQRLPRHTARESRVGVRWREVAPKAATEAGLRAARVLESGRAAALKLCGGRSLPSRGVRLQRKATTVRIGVARTETRLIYWKIRHAGRKDSRGVPIHFFRHIFGIIERECYGCAIKSRSRKETDWPFRHVCAGNSTDSRNKSAVHSAASPKMRGRSCVRRAGRW